MGFRCQDGDLISACIKLRSKAKFLSDESQQLANSNSAGDSATVDQSGIVGTNGANAWDYACALRLSLREPSALPFIQLLIEAEVNFTVNYL